MGYFYWLRVKSSNHLHTELNLGYLKGTVVTAPQLCLFSRFLFIVFRFSISPCVFIIHSYVGSHFRLRNISVSCSYFHPLFLLFGLASSAVSFLVAVVITF